MSWRVPHLGNVNTARRGLSQTVNCFTAATLSSTRSTTSIDFDMPSATRPDSRSPSPAPAPPIAETPGPRAQGFINIFNATVEKTLEKCSAKNFASCFPTAAQYSPEILDNLRQQIVEQLDHTWKAQFEGIMANRDVVKSVNSLEQCIEDAKLRKKRAEANANGGPVETPIP